MIPSSLISSTNNIIRCIQQTCGQNFLPIKTLDVSIQQGHGHLILETLSSGFRVTEGLWGFSPGKMCDIKSQVYNSLFFSRKFLSDERSSLKFYYWLVTQYIFILLRINCWPAKLTSFTWSSSSAFQIFSLYFMKSRNSSFLLLIGIVKNRSLLLL